MVKYSFPLAFKKKGSGNYVGLSFSSIRGNNFYGIQLNPFYNSIKDGDIKGLQAGLINSSENYRAHSSSLVQIGFGNTMDGTNGGQAGVFNYAEGDFTGIQLGLAMNSADEGEHKGLQIAPVNDSNDSSFEGVRIGLINSVTSDSGQKKNKLDGAEIGVLNYDHEAKGAQIGAVNISSKYLKGLQIGPICFAGEGDYVQLGLLTVRRKRDPSGKWKYKVSPLIGLRRDSKK